MLGLVTWLHLDHVLFVYITFFSCFVAEQSELRVWLGFGRDLVPFFFDFLQISFPLFLISHSAGPQEFLQYRKVERKLWCSFWRKFQSAV